MSEKAPDKLDMIFGQAVEIAGFLVMMWLAKKAMSPDFGRGLKMRSALFVKKVADSQAQSWQTVASQAANVYNKARV